MTKWEALRIMLNYVSYDWDMQRKSLTPVWLASLMSIAERAEEKNWSKEMIQAEMEEYRYD